MADRNTISIYNLVVAAIVLLLAVTFIIYLNRAHVAPNPAEKLSAVSTTAPAEETAHLYSMPTVNPFPSDEEINKSIEEQAKRQERLKEKIAERDKRAEIVRAEIVAMQDQMLADEVKNAQRTTAAPSKPVKAGSTMPYVKKGLSDEIKQKIMSGGYHVGH